MSSLYRIGEWLKRHLPDSITHRWVGTKEAKVLGYGPPQTQIENIKKYENEKIGLIILLIGMWLMVLFYSMLTYKQEQAISNVIDRPVFGQGNQELELRYSWVEESVYDYPYVLEIIEQLGPKENMQDYLASQIPELERHVLGKNLKKEEIKEDLRTTYTPFDDKNILVSYLSHNTQVLTHQGRIRFTQFEVPTQVQMEVTLSYGENHYRHIIDLQLQPRPLSKREYYRQLEAEIAVSEKTVILPEIHEKGQWYLKSRGLKPIVVLVVGGLLIYGFIILKYYEAKKMKSHYQEELLEDLPRFIQSLSLLMHAGATLQQAWHRISSDYQRRTKGEESRKLYDEILYLQSAYEKGIPFSQGLTALDRHCQILELSRLVSMLLQNIKKGNEFLVQGLDALGREAWQMKIDQIKKKGEKISTQLLLPMMLQLLIILMMVLAPAFISMSI